MLWKVIGIPEGVYYRGRFRATTVWSRANKKRNEGDTMTPDQKGAHTVDQLARPLLEWPASEQANTVGVPVKPAKR